MAAGSVDDVVKGERRWRPMDVIVVLAVLASFAVGAHVLGFGPFANTGPSVERADAAIELTDSAVEVEPSRPVEFAIPALGLRAGIDAEPCRLTDGALDPVNMDTACYYVADDRPYSLPGSDAPDVSVLAGHAASGRAAVFDDLYDAAADTFTPEKGDELLVRTEAGGDKWLVYEAVDFHSMDKASLGGDEDVWGTGPVPGRMLTISCIQPRNPFSAATHNVIVGWEYAGVSDGPAATAA